MSRVDEQPQSDERSATYDRLDLSVVANTDRILALPVDGGWREFPVPGDLSIPTMARLLILEKKLDDASGLEELTGLFGEVVEEIMRIVRLRTPDAPDPDLEEFGVKRINGTLAWLAGDVSVAGAFVTVLTPSPPVPGDGEPVVPVHAADHDEVHGEDPGPLASSERSSTPSSSSDGSTGGDRSGGGNAVGERSGSTPLTPASV